MTNSFRGKFPDPPGVRAAGTRAATAGTGRSIQKIFPSDLGAHYILFTFHNYQFQRAAPPRRITEGAIALPPPVAMTEKHNVDYNNSELGVIGGQLTELALEEVNEFARGGHTIPTRFGPYTKTPSSVFGSIVDRAKSRIDSFQNMNLPDKLAVASAPLRQGTTALAAGLNIAFANAPNPHVTAVFRGVQLNSHTFTWNLSPRSVDESYTLTNIISEFKRAMLPNFSTGGFAGALLEFPKVCSINHMGSAHVKFQTEYKDCVIKNLTAEYAPNGPSFFAGTGAPTHINITLNVQEIQIHVAEDHPEAEDATVQRQQNQGLSDLATRGLGISPGDRAAVLGGPGGPSPITEPRFNPAPATPVNNNARGGTLT